MTHPALRVVGAPRALRRWAIASLVANIALVVTGGLVRLTGSGLGCPTWPRCTSDSYVSHPALGIHGAIEFGNRMLTFVLIVIAVLTWVSAMLYRPRDRRLRWLTAGMALGIPAQGVVGGITVLTKLNPFVVAIHLLLSLVLVALAVWLVRLTWALGAAPASPWGVRFARIAFVGMWIAVWLGTVVTGSGPHAGDEHSVRTGFDPALVSHIHAIAVYLTIAATFGAVFVVRNTPSLLLLAVEVVQAGIGLSQYHLGLPIGLVLLHLLGAALAIAAATNLMLSVTGRAGDDRSGSVRPDAVTDTVPR
ncbi:COX15/CtaA family protein [Microlunatus ginsengisoli]|uniref:Cytochrome c oxidase assembly protein subunit 15 n=1 Tax=Microlunatus ginsengisoli TaxID=363863 RepID=A0ABP7A8I2_9ACTN